MWKPEFESTFGGKEARDEIFTSVLLDTSIPSFFEL